MDTYYVASPIRHTFVSAENEADAWIAGHEALHRIHTELLDQTGEEIPVEINHVRLATPEEVASRVNSNESSIQNSPNQTIV